MAVYEHTYQAYTGALTPAWSRFLIIPRHTYREVFRSKFFTGFFALCFACPLVMMILIYLGHNVGALAIMKLQVANLVPIDAFFFRTLLTVQGLFGFVLTVLVGPMLISRDLANNGLPLYLSRPFSRAEYLLGKASVLVILLSSITWLPGLLLFLFQCYLEAGWFTENYWIGFAILVSGLTWSLILPLLSLALSAWVKWRLAAGAALFGLMIIPNVIGLLINDLFNTCWGNLINLVVLMQTITDGLFRQWNSLGMNASMVLPVWGAWLGLIGFGLFCLLMLTRKVRAYEVIA